MQRLMAMDPKSFNLLASSSQAAAAGDWRRCADCYLQAYTSSARTWPLQYNCWSGYTSVLREDRFPASDRDVKQLKCVAEDESAPPLDRAQAYFSRGYVLFGRGDRPSAARAYRACIDICSGATAAQRSRELLVSWDGPLQLHTVGPMLDQCARNARDNLRPLDGTVSREEALEDYLANALESARLGLGTTPGRTFNLFIGPGVDDVEAARARLERATTVGGGECDRCAKRGVKLSMCARCKLSYYCSPACQKAAWTAGHKQACRKKGQFKPGDLVYLEGPLEDPELAKLNHTVVEVATAPDATGDLAIRIIGGDTDIPINAKNLRRGRPEA